MLRVTRLTLPQYEAVPAFRPKVSLILSISLDITMELRSPVVGIRRWNSTIRTILVLMPEATVNEYDFAP